MIDYAAVPIEEAALTGMALAVHAAQRPHDFAIADQHGQSLSWFEFNAEINRLARHFRSLGLGRDDGVALLCRNRVEFVVVFMAVLRAGLRGTPINWHLTPEEVGYIVDNCDAKVFVADALFAEQCKFVASECQTVQELISIGGALEGFDDLAALMAEQSPANLEEPKHGTTMLYTSGTTGHPKGVYRKDQPPVMPDTSPEAFDRSSVSLCTGPAYHAAPLAIDILGPLVSGCALVLMDKWEPLRCLELIQEHRVTHCHMVATMFHRLLQLGEPARQQFDVTSVRRLVHGAAPCPVHVKRQMIDWFGPVIYEYYAATEGSNGFLIDSHDWLRKPGSVGRPDPAFDNRLFDDDGADVPQGEVGTLYMRAPTVGRFEYYKDDGKTQSSYRGDYFTLGDMGYFDEDGYFFLTGRSAELIISGGVNIYPSEVDAAVLQHPAISDVCSIGVPNDDWGEEVKSVVQLNAGYARSDELAAELIGFTENHLARFKRPKSIDFVDELPRLPTGKIQRRIVREPYWAGRDRLI